MSDIDWSKAPAAATHVLNDETCAVSHFPWRRLDVDVWYAYVDGEWLVVEGPNPDKYTPRPEASAKFAAWDGTGLPPVGTICTLSGPTEYFQPIHPEWAGREVKIYANFTHAFGRKMAAYVSPDGQIGGVGIDKLFVPLPTPEQIAAQQRLDAINELTHGYLHSKELVEWAERAYDQLGYRKVVAE